MYMYTPAFVLLVIIPASQLIAEQSCLLQSRVHTCVTLAVIELHCILMFALPHLQLTTSLTFCIACQFRKLVLLTKGISLQAGHYSNDKLHAV